MSAYCELLIDRQQQNKTTKKASIRYKCSVKAFLVYVEKKKQYNNDNNNDRLFNLFAALTELQGGSLITHKCLGIMTRMLIM